MIMGFEGVRSQRWNTVRHGSKSLKKFKMNSRTVPKLINSELQPSP